MAIAELQGKNVPIKLWTKAEEVESSALDQLKNIAALPWAFHHIAVMADCHAGKGATIGSVVAMKNSLAPAMVGVDIGCGVGAMRTNLKASDLPDNLHNIRVAIEEAIPVGFSSHARPAYGHPHGYLGRKAFGLFNRFNELDEHVHVLEGKAKVQLGTLGGGNHFIELCLDSGVCECKQLLAGYESCGICGDTGKVEPRVWMMLHSGSRNIGKELAEIHIWKARKLAHNEELPDRDLAVFLAGTPEMVAYKNDLMWAQSYAFLNREVMFELYRNVLLGIFPQLTTEEPILCHHNYVSEETHFGEEVIVTRKGAISAQKNELGIIPGSMGTKSYIVRGKGNPESFMSASHGAGRRMSRGAAKRAFTVEDLQRATEGVECRKDAGVLDEIPGAYKPIEEVMANQADLVEIVAELKQVLCVKG